MSFWSGVGKVFKSIGTGALKTAVWAEKNPQIEQALIQLANTAIQKG